MRYLFRSALWRVDQEELGHLNPACQSLRVLQPFVDIYSFTVI